MSGAEESGDAAKFTGLAKYFNSTTNFGRANVSMTISKWKLVLILDMFFDFQTAKATYAFMALIGVYIYLKPKNKK